jgi:deoxycytidine triphosphate deaminase
MTIKSDAWLRRMVEEQQMIDPFLPELVREVDGHRIISAGSSSYGYDMRLADDGFRVFSPIIRNGSTRNRLSSPHYGHPRTVHNITCSRLIITGSA